MLREVLLVEDQGLVRAGMRTMLHLVEPQACVTEAGSFEEAATLLAQRDFEIVFLDIDLRAQRNGLDLLSLIRERELACKVIMLSGSEDRDLIMDCIAAGASGYIAKSSGNESVFALALSTVFQDGVFLPASVVGGGAAAASHPADSSATLKELGLSPRLCEVLYHVCQGLPNKSIARLMGISEGTVRKTYVSDLLRVFKVARRTELIIEVSRLGLRIPRPESKAASAR